MGDEVVFALTLHLPTLAGITRAASSAHCFRLAGGKIVDWLETRPAPSPPPS